MVSAGQFSSDLAYQLSYVILGVDAFVFWIGFKFVDFLMDLVLCLDDFGQTVHEFLDFLLFLRTGADGGLDHSD